LKKKTSQKRLKSFKDLKAELKLQASIIESSPVKREGPEHETPALEPRTLDTEDETRLFLKAMEGVTPICKTKHAGRACRPEHNGFSRGDQALEQDINPDIRLKMEQLIDEGKGFRIYATPEYHQGAGYNVHPEIMTRLHRGEYSIQDHIDLHGCTAVYADEVLEHFLERSIRSGKQAVLIVHGRGLSSKDEPVLKKLVVDKLSVGKWRKRVIAYTSAEGYDGGAGATYVLLRKHPVPRRIRKTTPHCSL